MNILKYIRIQKKVVTFLLLTIFFNNCLFVSKMSAHPGGPTQPETIPTNFSKENVDLFTGDFKYSIPLFKLGGYPINVSYSSGLGVDEEAGWVGLGWSLNPGAVNRIMRGVPDEFKGEKIVKEFYVKPNWTAGVNVGAQVQLANYEPLKAIKIGGSGIGLGLGVFYNSYNGLGTEVSVGGNLNLSASIGNQFTGGYTRGLRLTSNSQKGVDITRTYGLYGTAISKNEKHSVSIGVSGSSTFNNRTHLKNTFFCANISARLNKNVKNEDYKFGAGGASLGGQTGFSKLSSEVPTYMPKIETPMKISSFMFEAKVGGDIYVFNAGGDISGYYSSESISSRISEKLSYGYLNYQEAMDNPNAVLDLNREKDVPYHNKLPLLAIPNPTYDIFTASTALSGGVYRAHRTGSGVLYDPQNISESSHDHISGEANFGNVFEGGFSASNSNSLNSNSKWNTDNEFKDVGDFEKSSKIESTPLYEANYFKNAAEILPLDQVYVDKTGGFEPVFIGLDGNDDKVKAIQTLNTEGRDIMNVTDLQQDFSTSRKTVRQTIFNPLTLEQRMQYGMEKRIFSRKMNDLVHFYNPDDPNLMFDDVTNTRYYRPDHFSEIEIINNDGSRQVFGLPTYSVFSEDVTFGTNVETSDEYFSYTDELKNDDSRGKDHYLNKERMPSYPTSWLLTSALGYNYVDQTADGPTDDDFGDFVKFNYTKASTNFKWRLPLGLKKAKFNPGLKADLKDNKGSYSWGEREDWYVHSMESKTQIALFYINPRSANGDKGVLNEDGDINNQTIKYKLDSIKVFSKKDILDNKIGGVPNWADITPLKTVLFEYDYSLATSSLGGKLTLKAIKFRNGGSTRSEDSKYSFSYNSNPISTLTNVDRWGKFKDPSSNPAGLSNSDYPYTPQSKSVADANSKAWLLTDIGLPTGAKMSIEYESDDYAYVQNRRTASLFPIVGFENNPNNSSPSSSLLYEKMYYSNGVEGNHNYVYFPVNASLNINTVDDLKNAYFIDYKIPGNNLRKVFYKVRVNLSGDKYEDVSGYADIEDIGLSGQGNQKYGWIKLSTISEEGSNIQAVTHSSWRLMKNFLSTLTYPRSEINNPGPHDIILSLIGNIDDLLSSNETFPEYAFKKQFAKSVDLSKSFVRLCIPEKTKYGGGARVKQIIIRDNWGNMTYSGSQGNNGAPESYYGQVYEYTKVEDGKIISSGVAENEPMVGNDDSPLKQAIDFDGPKGLFDPSSFTNVELPIGESFYPSAGVGYSNVIVKSLASSNHPTHGNKGKGTGYSEHEFYTAKDFPVNTKNTNLTDNRVRKFEPEDDIGFFSQESKKHVTLTQGYLIELNDMHGKTRSTRVYNQKGGLTSSQEYFYKVNPDGSLNNMLNVIDNEEVLQSMTMGVDYDFITDMREAITKVEGDDKKVGGGFFFIGIAPIPWALPFYSTSFSEKKFRSAVTLKLIRRRGILDSTKVNEQGSILKTENLVWDKETGNLLLSKLNNEYKDPTYKLTVPAYWIYPGMGPTYRNINMIGDNSQNYLASIHNSDNYRGFCHGVLRNIVDKSQAHYVNYKLPEENYGKFLLSKSGYQNLTNLNSFEYLLSNNPLQSASLLTNLNVISEKNSLFNDEWSSFHYEPKFYYYRQTLQRELDYIPSPSDITSLECAYLSTIENIINYYIQNPGIPLPTNSTPISSILQGQNDKLSSNGSVNASYKDFKFKHSKGSNPIYATTDFNIDDDFSLLLGDIELRFFGFSSNSFKLEDVPMLNYSTDVSNCYYNQSSVFCIQDIMYAQLFYKDKPFDKTSKVLCKNSFETDFSYNKSNYGKWYKIHEYYRDKTIIPNTSIRDQGTITKNSEIIAVNNDPDFDKSKMSIHKSIANVDFKESLDIIDANGQDIQYVVPKGEFLHTQSPYYRYTSSLEESDVVYATKKRFLFRPEVKIEATNARYEEVLFYSFEDDIEDKKSSFEYAIQNLNNSNLSNQHSHTGLKSLMVQDQFTLFSKPMFNNKFQYFDEEPFYLPNEEKYNVKMLDKSKYNRLSRFNYFFEPEFNKDYLASVWVKTIGGENPNPSIELNFESEVSTSNFISSPSSSANLEGWKKIDVLFKLTNNNQAPEFSIKFNCPANSTCYFDDFRIVPLDAQSKSYVYDLNRLRKVAELDENHYATFFDYDGEGKLIRMRKETERGIMTINENRSSLVR